MATTLTTRQAEELYVGRTGCSADTTGSTAANLAIILQSQVHDSLPLGE